ncbi:MAG: aminotransferase class IV [Bacteroidota bacterium]
MISRKILGTTYVINGVPADVSAFIHDMSADIFYEVVRLIDGKVLFLRDHLDRFQHSLADSGLQFPGSARITENISLLVHSNDFTLGNIRICLERTGKNSSQLLCYFVPFVYPETGMYISGVRLVTYPHIRPKPRIKKWDNHFRVSVNQYIRDHGVYEALLLNDKKQITEGSRSNLFFLDSKNRLITPPEEEVLPGITRKYVLEICDKKGMEVVARSVHLKELGEMKAGFISGTSPKILPIRQIDGWQFRVDHPELRMIMDEFEGIIALHLTSLDKHAGN